MNRFEIRYNITAATLRRVADCINNDRDRGVRRMADSGRHLVSGANQKRVFEFISDMLKDPKNGYYGLFQQVCAETDPDLLAAFGANLLYSSLTYGTDINRELESRSGRPLPWLLSFCVADSESARRAARIAAQGAKLGIFAFALHLSADCPAGAAAEVLRSNPGGAFFVFAEPEQALELCKESALNNAALFIRFTPDAAAAAETLRARRQLWGVFCVCRNESEVKAVTSGEWLVSALSLRSAAAVSIAGEGCAPEQRAALREYARAFRSVQRDPVLAGDYFSDIILIDGMISNGPLFLGFGAGGEMYGYSEEQGLYPLGGKAGELSLAALLGLEPEPAE